jgi:DNA-binding response OmpR family regulator
VLNVLAIPPTEPHQRLARPTLRMYGKVLCVDDDPRVTRQLQLRLRDYGIDALREANGVEGFTTAVRVRPHLIITEFALPEGLGSYMLGRLRDCNIEIPVIFLTKVDERAYAGLRPELMELGAACFLQKPVNIQVLMAEVRKHIPLPDELFPPTELAPPTVVLPERTSDHEIAPHIAIQTGTRQRSSTDSHLPAPHVPRARTRIGQPRPTY